jgi:hypothetical protein
VQVVTTILEVLGVGGLVAAAALSPLPWLAFAVFGAGCIWFSYGLSRGSE